MTNLKLKEVRKRAQMTQKEVAEQLGISQNNYSCWETGKISIGNEMLEKLADFFGVSVDYLLGRNEKKEPSSMKIDILRQIQDLSYSECEEMEKYIKFLLSQRK